MAAVLGLATEPGRRRPATRPPGRTAWRWPANLNAPDQTVISGDPAAVARAGEGCKARGAKRVMPLKVSGAFHSPLMAPAVDGLHDALTGRRRSPTRRFPVIANASGEAVRTGVDAKRLLVDQLTAPVRWVACMQARRRAGARAPPSSRSGRGTCSPGCSSGSCPARRR